MKAYYATNKILIETDEEEMEYLKIGVHLAQQFAEQMQKRENNTDQETEVWEKCKVDLMSIESDLNYIKNSMPF